MSKIDKGKPAGSELTRKRAQEREKRHEIEVQEGSRFVFPNGGGMPDVYPTD